MREEELYVLVGKLAQLIAEDIVDAHMIGVSSVGRVGQSVIPLAMHGLQEVSES